MNILVDMNMSPAWVEALEALGHVARHWSTVGDPRATDRAIMEWARASGFTVLTNDLDLGTALALTKGRGPSVVQVRTQALLPHDIGEEVATVLDLHEEALTRGALVTIDPGTARVRILPLTD